MEPVALSTIVLLPFIGSLIASALPSNARNIESTMAGLIALFCAVQLAMYFPGIARGEIYEQDFLWLASYGLNLSMRMDGFAWMFGMLVYGIGALVVLYARYYMSPQDPVPRFFSFLQAFMGSMAGVVLAGNIIQLAFFWELTSIFSFLLIGYWHHRKDARRGARMALTVTGAGGLCLFAGALLLGHIVGSYDLDNVLAAGSQIRNHSAYTTVLVLVLLGVFTKSAQFPFHFWLPNAMAAPTPVSAYLHSATMVKAGVFLLGRFWPVLSGTQEWFWIVSIVGATTLLFAAFMAMFQNDLKGLLAYSTISHLGLITLLFGLNRELAAVAAVFHIMNHATFKASLFMVVGIVDHEAGTRDIRRLSGLRKLMPVTTVLALVATAAMAGVPFFNGFLSKEMFFAETVLVHAPAYIQASLPVLAVTFGIFSAIYSLHFAYDVFFGPKADDLPKKPHDPPIWMNVPVGLLVVICCAVGVLPNLTVGSFLAAAATPVVGGQLPEYSLAIWHGINKPLIMSVIALVVGTGLFFFVARYVRGKGYLVDYAFTWTLTGQRIFEYTLASLTRTSRSLRLRLTTNRLQWQMFWVVMVTFLAVGLPLWHGGLTIGDRAVQPISPGFGAIWFVGAICAIAAAWQAKFHRLASMVMLGATGLCVVLSFLWFSAPDLGLTQLTVEIATTILLLLGLRWLPQRDKSIRPASWAIDQSVAQARRARDLVIALVAGSGIALLTYAMLSRPFDDSASTFYLERAYTEGGGTNVVNVMLVDFRAFDTFGEIVVLAIVALTVYALLRRFRPARETMDLPMQQRVLPGDLITDLFNPRQAKDTAIGYLTVPAVLVRLLLPITTLVSVYFFMRGHNEPGGGFVAGLVFSLGLLLQYIVSGTQWVEANLTLYPRRWIAFGLAIAIATGAGAFYWDYPFMTTHTAHLELPYLGEIHIASAMFFDLGVFAVVVGATLLILTALAHQSTRGHRYHARKLEEEAEAREAARVNYMRAKAAYEAVARFNVDPQNPHNS
ncbi:monovalent cation/H+ antiporter subunit A [Vandammella animalimorsus]|uniref:Monovalent cation/H+ antiporter subunit A n=1 Tax=Vandammella animalimorsus TaxID=2029117 RepID=A0A2A2T3D2_9BURK|nr:monovalent cation/H+ antiporter subunit A [Vandammella animalimorsus]PAT31241.1 monovalent cation/H+ antiporter subunit A [Vandammella animalimorsus]PAX16066.1 monovalent cation/H+ antiporter subunit A [Vandammella animalimorsus]PAX20240.1 monovalent cation/H+ antiporter subunit A [Vandammella animalimorsus]